MISCINGKVYYRYRDYLNSTEWKNKRIEYFNTFEKSCNKCGSKEQIELHHITYENIGHEKITDLIALCSLCHTEHHKGIKVKPIKKKKRKSNQKLVMCSDCKYFKFGHYCDANNKTAAHYNKKKHCSKFSATTK